MTILKNTAAIEQYIKTTGDLELQSLLTDRVQALSEFEELTDISEIAHFYVVETAEELKTLDLPPIYEIREDHTDWTELVYVLSDDGFGLQVYVRKGLI
jgi:DNA integrity scanning protein DisA with diadenylate cyclase activity